MVVLQEGLKGSTVLGWGRQEIRRGALVVPTQMSNKCGSTDKHELLIASLLHVASVHMNSAASTKLCPMSVSSALAACILPSQLEAAPRHFTSNQTGRQPSRSQGRCLEGRLAWL